jgi:type I restriction enzyme S subunit
MKNFAAGAAQPKLGIYKIKEVEIPYPEYLVRQEIDGILDKYDNLIENNNRRIAILEDMSQSLYREWFVKFRFPSYEKVKFKGSPLGQIPEGWEVKAIQDFGEVITGKTPSKKKPEYYSSPDVAFLKTPDMHGSMFATDIVDYMSKEGADSQKKKYIPKNSICVACIGAKAGVVAITPFEVQTNQQINAVVLFEEYFREYLYLFAVSLHEKIHAIGSSGATMTNVSKGKFESIEVAFPEVELLRSFSQAVAPIFDEILNLQKKNTNLKKQRDMLLPKLISGKINL